MRLYEVNENYVVYEYNDKEFFQWEKDIQEYKKANILLSEFKAYGQPLYYIFVDCCKPITLNPTNRKEAKQ